MVDRDAATEFLIAVENAVTAAFVEFEDGEVVPAWWEAMDRAAETFRAVLHPPGHEPGDNHHYRIECEVCGERGVIRLSVDPERVPVEPTG